MKTVFNVSKWFVILSLSMIIDNAKAQSVADNIIDNIESVSGLVAYWDFSGEKDFLVSKGKGEYRLNSSRDEDPVIVKEGPLSGNSIYFDGTDYLYIPYSETGKLNVKTNAVTVVAWVKWTGEQTGFVAGMWNEYKDGGKRQYGLFVSLPYYNGKDQVCGHISYTGKPTPPFPYSIDYSASEGKVPMNEWCCVAFTYDGTYIRSYLNGVFEKRDEELIEHTKGFDGYPEGLRQCKNPYYFPYGIGDNGSDFTVGAVLLKNGMGNFFKGQIGGIAVYDKSLSDDDMRKISNPFNKED